ncbi:YceD family protein [Azohydromonas sediminis]|uniref:YceD family protein n=1 Tax=Azohydromonas sediminis TaxID=2259674 RepID=UPI000E6599FA|nr:DUF177 domain-containing protein [Azohydromonas sediminis]
MKPKPRVHDPRRLDVAAFAADGGELQGHWPLAGFARLADDHPPEAPPVHGDVTWHVRGVQQPQPGGAPRRWLEIDARLTVVRRCQRCLHPVSLPLHVGRRLRFVDDEAQAAELDLESDDDVLALERALDLHELIEDELLLAMPMVPRHDACRPPRAQPSPSGDEAAADKPHPFAALADWRGKGRRH